MNRFILSVWIAGFWVLQAQAAETGSLQLDSAKTEVKFLAVGKPGFVKIRGAKAHAQGSVPGQVTVKLDEFDSGIELRDRHMKEKYLETAKFPQAILTFASPVALSGGTQQVAAKLSLHGVEKPISLEVSARPEGEGTAKFQARLSDFGIDIPKYLGITVAETVEVEVDWAAKK